MKLKAMFGTLAIALVAAAVAHGSDTKAKEPALPKLDQAMLEQAAAITSQKLPTMADPETRWDSMKAAPNLTFEYSYTLINYNGKDIDRAMLEGYFPTIAGLACGKKEFKALIDAGVSAKYFYRGKDGVAIAAFQLLPKGCGTPPSIKLLPF